MTTTTLASFSYEGRAPLRVFGSPEEPLFIAQEVCDALGITAHRDALQRVPEWAQGRRVRIDAPGGDKASTQGGRFSGESVESESTLSGTGRGWFATLTEAGVYYLALRSNRPEAEAFQEWVCREVLPAIRKTGFYSATGGTPAAALRLQELEIETCAQRHLLAAEEARRKLFLLRGGQLAPVAEATRTISEWCAEHRPEADREARMAMVSAVKSYAKRHGAAEYRKFPKGNPRYSQPAWLPDVIAAALNLRGGVR